MLLKEEKITIIKVLVERIQRELGCKVKFAEPEETKSELNEAEVIEEKVVTVDSFEKVFTKLQSILRNNGFKLMIKKGTKDMVVHGQVDKTTFDILHQELLNIGLVKSTFKTFNGKKYATYRTVNSLVGVYVPKPL